MLVQIIYQSISRPLEGLLCFLRSLSEYCREFVCDFASSNVQKADGQRLTARHILIDVRRFCLVAFGQAANEWWIFWVPGHSRSKLLLTIDHTIPSTAKTQEISIDFPFDRTNRCNMPLTMH